MVKSVVFIKNWRDNVCLGFSKNYEGDLSRDMKWGLNIALSKHLRRYFQYQFFLEETEYIVDCLKNTVCFRAKGTRLIPNGLDIIEQKLVIEGIYYPNKPRSKIKIKKIKVIQ